jgi:hypothetical protein
MGLSFQKESLMNVRGADHINYFITELKKKKIYTEETFYYNSYAKTISGPRTSSEK